MNQTFMMIVIGGLCIFSALGWVASKQPWSAFAFLMFGLGYFGLAGIFAGMK